MNNTSKKIIKIEARLNRILFPKYPNVLGRGSNIFGIVSWYPNLILKGEPKIDAWGSLVIKGNYEEELVENKSYTIIAKETYDKQRGIQYELLFIGQLIDLSKVNNQKAFLKSFLTDNQISEMFKVLENPLLSIEAHDLDALKKVHGIGEYIANSIFNRFEENKDNCELYLKLDEYGLTPKFIQKLIKQYKNPNKVIEIVKNDPYQLSFDLDGVGFKTADAIALKSGISKTSSKRIMGFINFLLHDLAQKGNSYITSNELTGYIFDEFGGKENILEIYYDNEGNMVGNNIQQAINLLKQQNIITIEASNIKSERKVYLNTYYNLEKEIAKHLKRIATAKNKFEYDDWETVVTEQENKQGWQFTKEQRDGIKAGLDNQVCFITGGAGTGKSSLVSGILHSLYDYSFAQTALAGKASARLQEVTGEEGYTIHRLLKFHPPLEPEYHENNPLPYDIIVLDEVSLVGGEIFLSLIKAIPNGSKLIILGDMGQLESIGCLNLAHDIYYSNFIKTIELTKIHRQAQKSGIILASKFIDEQKPIFSKHFIGYETMGELQDMHFDIVDSAQETRERINCYFKKYWNSNKVNSIMDIQILLPVKERGDACVLNLNKDVQEFINPAASGKNELSVHMSADKSFILREGDKIMCIKNNYNLSNQKGEKTSVFNGWCGILENLDELLETGTIYFPIINDKVIFSFNDLKNNIILGYASTVHKFQGSSAKYIIGGLDSSTPPNMRTKELMYTMSTRAEVDCTIVAQNSILYNAILTSGIENKNTFLTYLLDSDIKEKSVS